jgi:phospholipase D1/2
MDFNDVSHWEQNKLDRKKSSRMGWSDGSFPQIPSNEKILTVIVSISLRGPVVEDLRKHFVLRYFRFILSNDFLN